MKRSRDSVRSRGRGRLLRPAAIAGLAAVAALILLRGSVERAALTNLLTKSTGSAVSMGSISDGLGSLRIDNLHVDAGSGLTFDAAQTDVALSGAPSIRFTAPRLSFDADSLAGDQADRIASTIAWLRSFNASIAVQDGAIEGRPSASAQPALSIRDLTGRAALAPGATDYRAAFNVVASGAAYPVTAAGHGTFFSWTAPALPAAILNTFSNPSAFTVRSGLLRDVSLDNDGTLRGSATLADVDAALAAFPLEKLNGPVSFAANHIGSTGIKGTFLTVPFSFAGESQDLVAPWQALHDGTRDLRAVARLLGSIGGQPNLTFARIELTAPGIVFGQYGVTSPVGPHVVQLIALDPSETTLQFNTALSGDHVISKGERTSDLAVRTNAVAGVNGDYFDIGRTYEPQGMLIKSGSLVRSPTDRASLIIDRSNHVTFSEFHLAGSVKLDGRSYALTQYNSWPLKDATVITPEYGESLRAADGIVFARLDPIDAAKHTYRITSVERADHDIPVSFGVAFGPDAKGANPRVGDTVSISYAFSPPVGPDVVAGIGGGPILLRNGQWYEDPHAPAPDERDVRWPVVAFGTLADGTLLFAAVDGRHPERSVGMTRPEFAELLKSFGVTDAMALDSGGSVTMVARTPGDTKASVHNTPSDNSAERYISDALLVYSSAPPNTIVTAPAAPSPSPSPSPAS